MSKKTTTVIKEEVMPEHDSPAVLAYRVGQLEKTTAQGFKEVKEELVGLKGHFVSKTELNAAIELGTVQHAEFDSRITKIENILTWVARIIIGAVIAAVLGVVIVH